MANRPSFQFYPSDWLSNTNLRRCTFEEKGVWLEIICLMNDSDEYGILRWTIEDIAIAVRCEISIIMSLVNKGVLKGSSDPKEKVSFSTPIAQKNRQPIQVTLIEEQGGPFWYSSRMVRDEYKRKKRAEGGYKSIEHPNVPKKKNEKVSISPSLDCSSSSSSSASTSTSTSSILINKQIVLIELPEWLDKEVWHAFVEHRKTMRAPMSDIAKTRAINKLRILRDQGGGHNRVA